jgi:hypothetical protein
MEETKNEKTNKEETANTQVQEVKTETANTQGTADTQANEAKLQEASEEKKEKSAEKNKA